MKVRPALGWISRALAVSGLIVLNAALLPAPALAETEYFVKLDAAGNPVEIFVVVDDVFTAMEQDLYGNSMTMGELLDLGNYLNSVEDAKKGADGKAAAEDGGAPEGTTDQETPRSDSDSELKSPCERQGNPVALATGEKYLEQTDFVLGGEYGMSLQRTYRSSGGGAMFGTKWSNNLQGIRLTWSGTKCSPEPGGPCAPAQVTTQEADYSRYTYTSPSDPEAVGVYSVQNNQAMGSIVYSQNGTWTMYRGRFVYGFASNGKLSTVKSSGGATLLTYVWGTYGPTSITNAVGQVVTFTWTSNRVTQVTLPGNKVWTYAYNGNGTLASVTAPGTPADVRSYHYENGSDATLLTGMDERG